VIIADLNLAAGQAMAAELGATARFAVVDVASEGDVQQAVKLAGDEFGGLHVAINCAGILGAARIVGRDGPHDLALFERVVRVNLIGTFNVLRWAAAAMSENSPGADGERGVIINTASVAAWEGQIGQAAYAASKGGVAALTLPAARELARHGVRVVAIAPGVFETPMMGDAADEIQQSLAAQIPFPSRFGKPDEFASLAQHVIENRMLNGCALRLDGALRMGSK
jgi:NAD(P)-dependent dehydrogenase (short-subunit alcohol dehydrogenase family)